MNLKGSWLRFCFFSHRARHVTHRGAMTQSNIYTVVTRYLVDWNFIHLEDDPILKFKISRSHDQNWAETAFWFHNDTLSYRHALNSYTVICIGFPKNYHIFKCTIQTQPKNYLSFKDTMVNSNFFAKSAIFKQGQHRIFEISFEPSSKWLWYPQSYFKDRLLYSKYLSKK